MKKITGGTNCSIARRFIFHRASRILEKSEKSEEFRSLARSLPMYSQIISRKHPGEMSQRMFRLWTIKALLFFRFPA